MKLIKREVKKMQANSRVGRRRALQILTGEDESPRSNHQLSPTHFRCKMGPERKRTFKPWAIKKRFTQEIRRKPATIRSNNESKFVVEMSNEKESKVLPIKTSLSSPQFQETVEVEIFACNKINQSQGLIYIHYYKIPDV